MLLEGNDRPDWAKGRKKGKARAASHLLLLHEASSLVTKSQDASPSISLWKDVRNGEAETKEGCEPKNVTQTSWEHPAELPCSKQLDWAPLLPVF